MATRYIVKFKTIVNEDFSLDTNVEADGFAEFSEYKNSRITIPNISVRTCENKKDENNVTLFSKYITNNFGDVVFEDEEKKCYIKYFDGYLRKTKYISSIGFDDSSASAYTDFKNNFKNLLETKYETEYYSNGSTMYVGEILYDKDDDEKKILSRKPHGTGTLYYNNVNNSIKYEGEFEDGKFDGAGIFYSADGKITLVANNISNGVPNQKGKLNINYTSKKDQVDINFTELYDIFEIKKNERQDFVMSNDFVNKITSKFYNNGEDMEELSFKDLNSNQQRLELWIKLKNIEEKIPKILERKEVIEKENLTKVMLTTILITIFVNFGLQTINNVYTKFVDLITF